MPERRASLTIGIIPAWPHTANLDFHGLRVSYITHGKYQENNNHFVAPVSRLANLRPYFWPVELEVRSLRAC